VTGGCGVCSSLSFFSSAWRSLRSAAASAARSGSRGTQYAAAQKIRNDIEICIRDFLRQKGGCRNSFPGWNHIFPCPGPRIKQHRPQHEPPDLAPGDFDSALRVEGIAGAQELEGLPPNENRP